QGGNFVSFSSLKELFYGTFLTFYPTISPSEKLTYLIFINPIFLIQNNNLFSITPYIFFFMSELKFQVKKYLQLILI
ncbi:MAG: hypothetical protein AB1414_07050, partial [bacterium]